MPPALTSATLIQVDDGDPLTWGQFVADNAGAEPEDLAEIAADLASVGESWVGGGAGALQVVRLVAERSARPASLALREHERGPFLVLDAFNAIVGALVEDLATLNAPRSAAHR